MYNLFLDDIRQPAVVGNYILPVDLRPLYRKEEWYIVRNYHEFVDCITKNGSPKIVSFDHDLAEIHYDPATWREGFKYEEETGLDCAKWLINYCMDNNKKLPFCLVHSMNPVGRENIINLLKNYEKRTQSLD